MPEYNENKKNREFLKKVLVGVVKGVVVGVAGTAAAGVALPLLGFTTAGVAGGSIAAGVQSSVYAGATTGVFSTLQSLGATGALFGTSALATGGTAGAVVGGVAGAMSRDSARVIYFINASKEECEALQSWLKDHAVEVSVESRAIELEDNGCYDFELVVKNQTMAALNQVNGPVLVLMKRLILTSFDGSCQLIKDGNFQQKIDTSKDEVAEVQGYFAFGASIMEENSESQMVQLFHGEISGKFLEPRTRNENGELNWKSSFSPESSANDQRLIEFSSADQLRLFTQQDEAAENIPSVEKLCQWVQENQSNFI